MNSFDEYLHFVNCVQGKCKNYGRVRTSDEFYVICTVHCNMIIPYRPIKCTLLNSYFNSLFFTKFSTYFEPKGSYSARRLYVQV
jgi:hypothetical protein